MQLQNFSQIQCQNCTLCQKNGKTRLRGNSILLLQFTSFHFLVNGSFCLSPLCKTGQLPVGKLDYMHAATSAHLRGVEGSWELPLAPCDCLASSESSCARSAPSVRSAASRPISSPSRPSGEEVRLATARAAALALSVCTQMPGYLVRRALVANYFANYRVACLMTCVPYTKFLLLPYSRSTADLTKLQTPFLIFLKQDLVATNTS